MLDENIVKRLALIKYFYKEAVDMASKARKNKIRFVTMKKTD